MTRTDFINQFIAKYGPNLAMNIKGEHTYLVPVEHLANIGMKGLWKEIAEGKYTDIKGTPEAEQEIPPDELVRLISVIQNAPAASTGLYKLPDDPMGLTRVSLGGDTQQAVYTTYRGTIQNAIKFTEIALLMLKSQAEKGEAPPPPDISQN